MKIILDEDLPRSLGAVLAERGHEVFDVRDVGLRGKPDEKIFRFAQENSAVLFSADLGFSNILKFPLGSHAGIVILRFPNEMPTALINKITIALLEKISEEEFKGSAIVFSPSGARIRRSR